MHKLTNISNKWNKQFTTQASNYHI
jgi:hypothetical protein